VCVVRLETEGSLWVCPYSRFLPPQPGEEEKTYRTHPAHSDKEISTLGHPPLASASPTPLQLRVTHPAGDRQAQKNSASPELMAPFLL
jgi:hypothetical protein